WWVFTEDKQKLVCAIDLNGLQPANQEQHLYCADYGAFEVKLVDFPQITQVDSESNKRYVLLLSEPNAHVLSVDKTAHNLNYEYRMPDKITTPHSDVGQDREGRQVLFWGWYDPYGNMTYLSTGYLNKGVKITRPVEEGGGLSLLYPLYTGHVSTGMHFGCNWSGYCVVSSYGVPATETAGIPSYPIADIKAGSCVVQMVVPHPFTDGSRVVIGGAGEMSDVNGVSKIRVIDAKSFVLEGRTC